MRNRTSQNARPVASFMQPLTPSEIAARMDNANHVVVNNRIKSTWRYSGELAWSVWHGVIVSVTRSPYPFVRVQWMSGEGVEDLDDNGVLEFPLTGEDIEIAEIVFIPPPTTSVRQPSNRPSSQPPSRGGTPSRTPSPVMVFDPPAPSGDALRPHASMQGRLEHSRFTLGQLHLTDRDRQTRLLDLMSNIDKKLDAVLCQVALQSPRTPTTPRSEDERSTTTTTNTDRQERTIAQEVSPASPVSVSSDDFPPGVGFACLGCDSFGCLCITGKKMELLFLKRIAEHGSKQVAAWLQAHELLHPFPSSCGHRRKSLKPEEPSCNSSKYYFRVSEASIHYVCSKRGCGKEFPAHEKRVNPFGQLEYVLTYIALGRKLSEPTISRFSAEAARQFMRELSEGAIIFNAESITMHADREGWKYMEWDETFHGQRKYQRGHRTRASGTLTFVGGVTKEGGRIIDGIIAGVPGKSREQQMPLLLSMTAPDAVVVTDGAAMYTGTSDAGRRHRWVNHKKEFANRNGDNTNSIEGFWSVLKRKLRTFYTHNTSDARDVAMRYQLACFLANARQSGSDDSSAAMLLYRTSLTYKRHELYSVVLEAAVGVFGTPNKQELDRWISEREASEAASAVNACTPLPLNQLDDAGLAAPTLPRKLHMSEGARSDAQSQGRSDAVDDVDREEELFGPTVEE